MKNYEKHQQKAKPPQLPMMAKIIPGYYWDVVVLNFFEVETWNNICWYSYVMLYKSTTI